MKIKITFDTDEEKLAVLSEAVREEVTAETAGKYKLALEEQLALLIGRVRVNKERLDNPEFAEKVKQRRDRHAEMQSSRRLASKLNRKNKGEL